MWPCRHERQSQVCSGVRGLGRLEPRQAKPDLDELNVPDGQIGGALPQLVGPLASVPAVI